ncbi:hypothetical protein FRC17_007554 [Serendipita sp. 399]|nr:hypothetical protein FRC17_007554 [Serendipita sp. 399]
MAAIRKQCGKDCEFVYAEAPIVLKPVDLPQNLASIGAVEPHPPMDSSTTGATVEVESPELIARGWWLRDRPESMRICISFMAELLKEHDGKPFDGVLGFSQGACAAALLTVMLENPDSISGLLSASPGGDSGSASITHPCLKFCILIAGFRPRFVRRVLNGETQDSPDAFEDELQRIFDTGIHTPTLHVLGENDQIVGRERSQTLIDVCDEQTRRIERHEGGKSRYHKPLYPSTNYFVMLNFSTGNLLDIGKGHFVPSKTSWRHFFARYIHLDRHSDSDGLSSPNPMLTEAGTGSGWSTPGFGSGTTTPRLD